MLTEFMFKIDNRVNEHDSFDINMVIRDIIQDRVKMYLSYLIHLQIEVLSILNFIDQLEIDYEAHTLKNNRR